MDVVSDVSRILEALEILKTHITPLRLNDKIVKKWKRFFLQDVTPFISFLTAKSKQIFSGISRVEPDWRNHLSRNQLDVSLCIEKVEPTISKFNQQV